jgi:hypothetical protein
MSAICEIKKPTRALPDRQLVNTYELIIALDEVGALNLLVVKGIIPITYLDFKDIYKCYKGHRKQCGKMQSYENAAEEMAVTPKTVMRVVKRMES